MNLSGLLDNNVEFILLLVQASVLSFARRADLGTVFGECAPPLQELHSLQHQAY